MIFVHDKGRMANNILQYGHLYAWGREHGRQTISMRFSYKYQWFHICHTRYHRFLTYVLAKYAARWGLIPTVRFDVEGADYSREEQLMLTRRFIWVGGWYARWYDLFLKYKQEILGLFAFDKAVEHRVSNIVKQDGTLRLGIHVRRGDYSKFNGGRFFYSDAQYVALIRQFHDLHHEPLTVYICGNDPNIDKQYYIQSLSDCRIIFPEGNPAEDLCVLSHCEALIGPPSTFSLVAAMYHDLPLYWVKDAEAPVTEASFRYFDELFLEII